jgi:hypothetical protein
VYQAIVIAEYTPTGVRVTVRRISDRRVTQPPRPGDSRATVAPRVGSARGSSAARWNPLEMKCRAQGRRPERVQACGIAA